MIFKIFPAIVILAGMFNHVQATTWYQMGGPIEQPELASTSDTNSISLSDNGPRYPRVAVGSKGFARVYELNYTGSWSQLGQDLITSSGASNTVSVSLSGYGNFVAVGDPFSDANGTESGQVRVYNLDDNTNLWVPVGNAIVGPSEENFGRDLQLSGYPSSSAPSGFSGDAYLAVLGNFRARVYKYSSSTVSWEQVLTDLTATGGNWSSPGFIDCFSADLPTHVTLSSSQGNIHVYTHTINIYAVCISLMLAY